MVNQIPHIKKHLGFEALRKSLSSAFENVTDFRQTSGVKYNLHDCLMSGFAMMYFQDQSLLEFQRRWEEDEGASNLQRVFNLKHTPCDAQFRKVLDNVDSKDLKPLFGDFFKRLQRNKVLEDYVFLEDSYLIPIDGSQYFSSEKVCCPGCLKKQTRGKKENQTRYHHQILQAVIVHPDKKQVFPLAPEEIKNTDGNEKQDCELNAGKRILNKIRKSHPKLRITIAGDGLFSKQSFISELKAQRMSYILVAKPDDHKVMFRKLENCRKLEKMHELEISDEKNNLHIYRWTNCVDLNGNQDTIKVNYFEYELFNAAKDKITYRNSWVTDTIVCPENVATLVRGGRARWKIENETFNTLKNQGYHLEHNFGHGDKNLSMNFFLLNLLAFYMHQIFQLSDKLYQKARNKFSARLEYWNQLRCTFRILPFDSWDEMLTRLAKKSKPP